MSTREWAPHPASTARRPKHHRARTVKLVGTAQRIVRHAWLFSSLIVVADEARLQSVLTDVYSNPGLPFHAASVGSVRAEQPALDIDMVEHAVVGSHGLKLSDRQPLSPERLAPAHDLVDQHRVRRIKGRATTPRGT